MGNYIRKSHKIISLFEGAIRERYRYCHNISQIKNIAVMHDLYSEPSTRVIVIVVSSEYFLQRQLGTRCNRATMRVTYHVIN